MHLLLPYFIIIIVVIQLKLRKNSKKDSDSIKKFWEREQESNNVRKKNIDNLDYITIPDNMAYEHIETQDSDIIKAVTTMNSLRSKKILNLTGYTNTDLKMQYGVGNLTVLTECDDNFATLVKTIATLGTILMERGYTNEAVELLEFGIQCNTDITANYTLLATYYTNNNQRNKIARLVRTAQNLKSMNKDVIISKLNAL